VSGADPTRDSRARLDSDPRDVCPVCRAWLLLRGDGIEACADPQCKAAHGVRLRVEGERRVVEVCDATGEVWRAPEAGAPAKRFQVVADLAREGKITAEQARQLLEMPALDADQLQRALELMLHPVTVVRGDAAPDPLSPEERAQRTRLAWWADLTDSERAELINLCCYTCGALNPSCRCGDDS